MGKRGRPRHPDILTPREWEVLGLLRADLSNDEIAQRLGITERTAKFHVSEILGKLGVANREEAARWSAPAGEARPWWALAAAPFALIGRKTPASLGAVAGATAAGGAIAGVVLLALLFLRDDGGGAVEPPAGAAQERLAFSAGGSIFTVAPDGSRLREVVIGDRAAVWNAAPALSPDGARLLFTRDYDIWAGTAEGRDARLLGDVAQPVTPPGASNPATGAQSVAWSPDGGRVLYTLARIGGSGIGDVWVMQPDGTERRQLYAGGNFLLASWLDGERVAALENGSVRIFRVTGEEEPPLALPDAEPAALIAIPGPDGNWLLGPFIDEGPISYGPPDAPVQVAVGLSPTLAPDGTRFAYFREDALRVASVDGSEDVEIVDLAPLGGRDRHFAEQPECFPDEHPACSYRPPLVSWWSPVKTYRDEALGISFSYPAWWTEGAPDSPVRPCLGCVVFGPPDADEPYGIRLYAQVLTEGCTSAGCLVGNGRRQLGDVREVELDGRDGLRVDIMASLPLGLVDEIGGFIEYREVWTAVRRPGDDAIFIVAFYREGDAAAGEETRAAYEALLRSLRLD